jgi:hypothetical protein
MRAEGEWRGGIDPKLAFSFGPRRLGNAPGGSVRSALTSEALEALALA